MNLARSIFFTRLAALAAPLLCALALLPGLLPAAHAETQTQQRELPPFEALHVSGSMDVVVRQGPQQVQLQGDEAVLQKIETVVESGRNGPVLEVRWKKGTVTWGRSKVVLTVAVPKLNAVALAGAGDVKVEAYKTPALQLSLSGSGDARLEGLVTEELDIHVSGSGNVAGNGSATRLKASISGSGDLRLADLKADEVKIAIAGSGDAAVNAQKMLSASVAGSGDVTYVGNPQLKVSVAGSGSVRKR